MLGIALIVAAVLFYKAYKLTLQHNQQVRKLEEENARLRLEVEEWKARYAALQQETPSPETDGPEMRVRQLAERIERQKSLFS